MHLVITILPYLIGLCLLAVVATLFTGLFTMAKGGEFDRRHSNQLMRLRVGLQALTIALLVLYFLLRGI